MVDSALAGAPGGGGGPGPGDGVQPATLSAVYKCWAELDLESLRGRMDDTGLKIAEYQEEALQNRRKLAESTREFKRTAGETPVKGLGPLLKQYQEEIDRLTKRCKHSEGAFLELYQKLYEAPDPAPALALAFETASRVADLEAQNKKLSAELAEFEAEAASIKNQDLTIRRLEDKARQLEAALEEKGLELEDVRASALAEADAARLAQMQEREAQLTAMLAEAQASLAAMQKLHTATQNQLFAMQSQSEDERQSRHAELELASAELERAQERLMALEREKQQLQHRLTGPGAGGAGGAAAGDAAAGGLLGQASGATAAAAGGLASVVEESMRQELYTQREVAARLRLEVTSLRQELDQAHSMWEARVEGLRASMQATEQHARALEEQLANRPTNQLVEDLRSQIRMLQAVGLNALAEDDLGDGEEGGAAGGGAGPRGSQSGRGGGGGGGGLAPGSLEALLLQKNRHLEHALTTTKLQVVDGKAQLDAATAQVMQLQAQLGEKVALVARLEEDLMESRKGWGAAPNGTATPAAAERSQTGSRAHLSGLLGAAGDGAADEAAGGGNGEDGAESSMVRVVCAQRDRFRARVQELEEQLVRAKGELQAARSEAAAAKADNIALVERLRYVHGFKQGGGGGGGNRVGKGGVDVEVGADAERRYGRLYDEGINPFKEFQGEQRERQKSQLHFADKLMYMFGQLVFGSTHARLGTFAYLVIMHLLVVGSLLRMTHHGSGALYAHTQHMLDSRHDVMSSMHHDAAHGAAAAAAGGHDSRLP